MKLEDIVDASCEGFVAFMGVILIALFALLMLPFLPLGMLVKHLEKRSER